MNSFVILVKVIVWLTYLVQGEYAALKNSSQYEYVEALDGRYFFPIDDSVMGSYLRSLGQWEIPTKDILLKLVKQILHNTTNDAIVLDIGANFGTWTVPLANAVGDRGMIFSIEAQLDMMNYLHTNILANGLSNVIPLHVVLSNTSGFVSLEHVRNLKSKSRDEVTASNYGSYSINRLLANASSATKYRVRQATLDELLLSGEIPSCPDVIKLDVENHELNIFLGAFRVLRECQPIILFEAECRLLLRSIETLLNSVGYVMGWLVTPSLDLELKWKNKQVKDIVPFGKKENYKYLLASTNMIAVPRSKRHLLSLFPNIIMEVLFDKGLYYIDEYNIDLCYGEWCHRKTSTAINPDCELQSSEYLRNYWMKFV